MPPPSDRPHSLVVISHLGWSGFVYSGYCTGCAWAVDGKTGADEIALCYRVAHK